MDVVKKNEIEIDDNVIQQDEVQNTAEPTSDSSKKENKRNDQQKTPEPAVESSTDQSVTKNPNDQTQDNSQVKGSGYKVTLVSDDSVNPDGTLKMEKVEAIETATGQKFDKQADQNTKNRRVDPMIKSSYEDESNDFKPAYSVSQVQEKDHTPEMLQDSGEMSESEFNKLPDSEKLRIKIATKEKLMHHPDTLFYHNVTHKGRTGSGHRYTEPVTMAINHGYGDYPIPGHMVLFEKNAAYQFDAYISDYALQEPQIIDFNASIPIGPVIGSHQTAMPTPVPTPVPTPAGTDLPTTGPTAFDVEL